MSRNKYQNVVENICVPTGLEERVLSAARRQLPDERLYAGQARPSGRSLGD